MSLAICSQLPHTPPKTTRAHLKRNRSPREPPAKSSAPGEIHRASPDPTPSLIQFLNKKKKSGGGRQTANSSSFLTSLPEYRNLTERNPIIKSRNGSCVSWAFHKRDVLLLTSCVTGSAPGDGADVLLTAGRRLVSPRGFTCQLAFLSAA
ncbi:hypothetical protein AAFF_G00078610 [Aldrovandia affinis]|uniref:Uncharacterized protein n=1 Tax=Aldrovandia affinis TaxID=143900 RepID=A0AAD7WD05_9TELE|nr:hypothetical protein AAFF_G00078610 [Aldrovandia affinis]